jgi:serine/threonine protein kinase
METLDSNIEPLWVQGARGIMFKVTLASYGYTVIAKGTVFAFVQDLRHEAKVYQRLQNLQGMCVPVFLGAADLDWPYRYDFQVRVVHMIFLSWGGDCIDGGSCAKRSLSKDEQRKRSYQVIRSVRAIHNQGVVHADIRKDNVLWRAETEQAIIIDFERAELVDLRSPLRPLSPNLKRKRIIGEQIGPCGDRYITMREEDVTALSIFPRSLKNVLEVHKMTMQES